MRKAFLMLLVLASAFTAYAQFDQGQITGTAKDSSQAVVAGAAVTVKSAGTGQSASTKTDPGGNYLFTNLPLGDYQITVQAAGFKAFIRTGVRVSAATRTTVDAALEVGAASESITVSATTAAITLDTAQIGRTIDSSQITDLALNGRNPFNMASLKAGVVGDQFNGFNPGWVEQSVSINGGRKNGNQVTMDGVNLSRARGDAARNTNIGVLNVDAVQEVQILTTTYPAEYGRAMDGQVRFVTKSGGRDFHGTAWEFLRNSRLDANSWTRNSSPKASENARQAAFRFNQPGYSIGGPVVIPKTFNTGRNKIFFFVSQEWVWYRKEQTTVAIVPTALMRKGDFSELLSASNPFFGRVRTVKDPASGLLFPGNVVPASLRSRNGMAFMNAFPLPTPGFQQGTNNWIKTLPNPITNRKDTLRFDYYLGSSRISFSGNHYGYREDQPFSGTFGSGLDTNNTRWNRPNKLGAFAVTTTLSPTKVNDITVSGAADRVELDPYVNPEGHDWIQPRSQYGIDYPYMISLGTGGKTLADRIPNNVSIAGLSAWGGGVRPTNSSGPIYSVADNFTYVAAAEHTLKFGVWAEKATQKNNEIPGNQNGNFSFGDTQSPVTTSLAMANTVMGNFDTYSEAGRRPYTLATSYAIEAYAQDTWKPTQKLTVEMGVRWSFRTPWVAKYNDFSGFDPKYYDPKNMAVVDRKTGYIVSGDVYNGVVMPGNGIPDSAKGRANAIYLPNYQRLFHDIPRGFSTPVYRAFAPRLGIAYRLANQTALRLGGGIFHQRQMAYGLFGGPPNQETLSVSFAGADNPGGESGGRYTPFSVTTHDGYERYPTSYSYSFSIQHELPGGTVIDVAYVGKTSVQLIRTTNTNAMAAGTLQANPGIQPNALRPWQGLSTLNRQSSTGRANYNAFQVSLDRRFHSGLGFGLSYTWSKGLDNITTTANTYYLAWAKAPFEWDAKHLLNLNVIYELPFLKGRRSLVGNLFGGWQISSVAFIRTGFPLSVTDSNDMAGVGQGTQVWNLVGKLDVSGAKGVGQQWFNPAAFSQPAAGTFGNAAFGVVRASGFKNLDATLFKRFRLHERLRSEFRFEAFNLLNHPNLGNPGLDPRAGGFGVVTAKALTSQVANVSNNERNVQLALKFIF